MDFDQCVTKYEKKMRQGAEEAADECQCLEREEKERKKMMIDAPTLY